MNGSIALAYGMAAQNRMAKAYYEADRTISRLVVIEDALQRMAIYRRRLEGIDQRFRALYLSRMNERRVKRNLKAWRKAWCDGIDALTFAGPDWFRPEE